MDRPSLDADIAGCAAAHQRLLNTLEVLDEHAPRRPSLLPGWTVAHVLTHLARNADSFTHVIQNAGGEPVMQYPGGLAQRNGDIEAGAGRSAAELVADVRGSIWRLEQAWAVTDATVWGATAAGSRGEFPVAELPMRRWREVEVHHADLGLAFTWRDWSEAYVRRDLPVQEAVWAERRPHGSPELPPAARAMSPHERLAWLTGRVEIPGVAPAGIL